MRGNPAAPNDALGFHFEDVGEIAADGNFQIESDCLRPIIGQVDVLMDTSVNGSANRQADAMAGNLTLLRGHCAVGEENARGVMRYAAAVEEIPGHAIGGN